MDSPWGNPAAKTFRKRCIRQVKTATSSVLVHIEIADLVAEILRAGEAQGIHFPEVIEGWVPFVKGEDLREWGLSFQYPVASEWPGFVERAGDLVFTGTLEEARAMSNTVEQDRVIRLTPQLEKAPEAWQTALPGARTIRAGAKGDDVQFVQMALNCPTQDGTYDLHTTEAVMALQGRFNMRQSGVMDESTWKALLPTTGNYIVEFGETSQVVRILQAALYAYDWDSDVVVTGRFDTVTLRAVRNLQDTYGLRLSGVMGGPEWAALLGRPVRIV